MKTIIRVAAEYGPQVATAMASAAGVAGSLQELLQHAYNIAHQWQAAYAAVEQGNKPTQPHPRFVYFCWEWDARFNCWRLAQWNGQMWVLL